MKFRILASLGLLFLATPAFAQASKDLVGSWTLVSSTVQQGANTLQPFGADPKGALIFGADGRYVAMIARAGLPKFAGDNRHDRHAGGIQGDRERRDRAFRQLRGG